MKTLGEYEAPPLALLIPQVPLLQPWGKNMRGQNSTLSLIKWVNRGTDRRTVLPRGVEVATNP